MGKGSSSTPTSTNTVQTSLPSYAAPYFQGLMGVGMAQASTPFQAYQGQQVADFAPMQQAAQAGLAGFNPNSAAMNTSGQINTNVANAAGSLNPNVNVQNWTDPGVAQQYMSPYTQNVLDAQKANMNVDYQMGVNQAHDQAAAAGAFGGDRQAIQDAAMNRTYNQQLQQMEATGLNNAYSQGQNTFNTAQGQSMQAQQNSFQNALGSLNPQLQAAGNLSSLGQAQNTMGLNYLNALNQMGGQQQQQQQNLLNTAQNNWTQALNWNQNQLGWLGNLMHGVPVATNTTSQQAVTSPSQTSQLAGLGIGALGLNQALSAAPAAA